MQVADIHLAVTDCGSDVQAACHKTLDIHGELNEHGEFYEEG